ncbi:MAG TPA: hypothetical protein PLW70_03210, partial [Bacteroidales bacterium]|nr:hypothetical protein [Bacteroidales bacterium]
MKTLSIHKTNNRIGKKISIVIFQILLVFSCFGQALDINVFKDREEGKLNWEKDTLLGKVKSYTEISYKVEDRFGKIE